MIRLGIWITLPACDRIQCGEMVCQEPDHRGRMQGAFRYSPQWLHHSKRFPLDPVALPLSAREFVCDRPGGVFSVFEDSLPDDWGRKLLIRKTGLKRGEQTPVHLLRALDGRGLGALSYYPEQITPAERNYATLLELEDLVTAALDYEAGRPLDDNELRLLFAAASSPGGARPKALVRTEDGREWIAKFPSNKDGVDMVAVEAATLSLAGKAGLNVPSFRVEPCGKFRVLLLDRFDITAQGGRRHMLSFQTVMQAEGYYTLGYADLFGALRKIASRPRIDMVALYRQMVFNGLIGNTDDHLKNFTLLHDDDGFHLSPAYDLLPDVNERREHVLGFRGGFLFPGLSSVIALGRQLKIRGASDIVRQIRDVIENWRDEFRRWSVPDKDIERLSFGIGQRLKAT